MVAIADDSATEEARRQQEELDRKRLEAERRLEELEERKAAVAEQEQRSREEHLRREATLEERERAAEEKRRREEDSSTPTRRLDRTRKVGAAVTGGSVSSNLSILLFVAALVIHLVHGLGLGFAPVYTFLIPVYFTHALLLAFVVGSVSGSFGRSFFKVLGVSVLFAGLSVGITLFLVNLSGALSNGFVSDIAKFTILLFPVYLYYVAFNPELEMPHWLRTGMVFLVLAVLVLAVVTIVGEFTFPQLDSYQGVDATEGFSNVFDRLWDGVLSFGDSLGQAYNATQQRLDPNYYTSRVEEGDRRPLGVRLEQVEPTDPYFLEGQEPRVSGFVSAQSVIEETLHVQPSCRITRRVDGPAAEGRAEPASLELFSGVDGRFECSFEPLDKGFYPVEVAATFDFETWADVTYYFVDEEKARDYGRLGQDINDALDIPEEPDAVFTDGPMRIGMGGNSRMPVLVSREEPYLENAYLGITLENNWRGDLNRVYDLVLIIPNSFELTDCNRGAPSVEPDPNVRDAQGGSLYDRYVFENAVDSGAAYTSVSCRLRLDDPSALPGLQTSDVATRTFIAMARYSFTTTEETEVRVEE